MTERLPIGAGRSSNMSYADTVLDFDLADFLDAHRRAGARTAEALISDRLCLSYLRP